MNTLYPERRLFLEIGFAKPQQATDGIIERAMATIRTPKRCSKRQATENRARFCEIGIRLKMVCHWDGVSTCQEFPTNSRARRDSFRPSEKLDGESTRRVLITRDGR